MGTRGRARAAGAGAGGLKNSFKFPVSSFVKAASETRNLKSSLQSLQECLRLFHARKQLLFRLKLCRMDAAAAAAQFDRMLQVQHFVIKDVLQDIAWHSGVIENPADDDGVVRGIVMPQAVAGALLAPGQ